MELLESSVVRPRQARYQAALRPDKTCCIYSSALRDSAATSTRKTISSLAKVARLQLFCYSHALRMASRNVLGLLKSGREYAGADRTRSER
jgi:hypothetical protein